MKVILAQPTKGQEKALSLTGIKFETAKVEVAEFLMEDPKPEKELLKMVTAKARVLAESEPKALIISCQSSMVYRNRVVPAPKFKRHVLEQLLSWSGRSHLIVTAWVMHDASQNLIYSGTEETRVFFRELKKREVEDYVNDEDVVRYRFGYSLTDSKAVTFIDRIEGDLNSLLYELPLNRIIPLLKNSGVI